MKSENFLRGRRRHEMSAAEIAAVESLMGDVREIPARTTMVCRGEPLDKSIFLISGTICRYIDAKNGERQLLGLHIPGEFVDLHAYPLRRLDHNVCTLPACTVAMVPHDKVTEVVEAYPHLARLLWFSTLLDGAMHREWIFRIGRLDALGRMAHFLAETHARYEAIGFTNGTQFELPLTQQDLGEACGLTSVHVNRTLRRLREDGVVNVKGRTAHILDRVALTKIGEFDPDYLYLHGSETTP